MTNWWPCEVTLLSSPSTCLTKQSPCTQTRSRWRTSTSAASRSGCRAAIWEGLRTSSSPSRLITRTAVRMFPILMFWVTGSVKETPADRWLTPCGLVGSAITSRSFSRLCRATTATVPTSRWMRGMARTATRAEATPPMMTRATATVAMRPSALIAAAVVHAVATPAATRASRNARSVATATAPTA